MDEIMATEDLLLEMEEKLKGGGQPHDDFVHNRVQSLKRKLIVLREDEDILVTSLSASNSDD